MSGWKYVMPVSPRKVVRTAPWLLLFSLATTFLAEAQFPSSRTRIEVGETRTLQFRATPPAAETATLDADVRPEGMIEVVEPPTVLRGESAGYVRIRGLRPGKAQLRLAGKGTLAVEVIAARTAGSREAIRITTPVPGSYVWGTFVAGVEVTDGNVDPGTVRLLLPDGQRLEPLSISPPEQGPTRRLVFEVDASRLPIGMRKLVAVGPGVESEPVTLCSIQPGANDLFAGECEAFLDSPRPERRGAHPPRTGSKPDASGGQFVLNASAHPAWCLSREIKEPGLYQMMIVARGTYAGGAYPSVGLCLDNTENPVTSARLVSETWHRVPVGRPVALEAGARTLTVLFMNDFYAEKLADRNLYLDRFELARVGGASDTVAEAGGAMMAGAMMQEGAGNAGSLRVAFTRPLHNQPVTGRIAVEGYCHWQDPAKSPPPHVTLLLNGKAIAAQQSADPWFWIDTTSLRKGTNSIQLVATDASGSTATTPVQIVDLPLSAAWPPLPRAFHRFAVHGDGWDESMKKLLNDHNLPKGHTVAAFASNGSAALTLPESLVGEFDLYLEARGEELRGPPVAVVSLETGATPQVITNLPVSGWWNTRPAGRVSLPEGPKRLHIAFTNDLCEAKVGDRNLWLKSVLLQQPNDALDRSAPRVKLLYPKPNHAVFGADAVVAEAFDDRQLEIVDVWIDGKPQQLNFTSPSGLGAFTFPLVTRGLAPGRHRLMVVAHDREGNLGESEEIWFVVADRPPREPGTYARAVRLLKRFGYGVEPDELAAVLTLGERRWLEKRLREPFDSPAEQAALGLAWARFPEEYNEYHVRHRVAQQLVLSDNPVRTRFVMWAQNHFSTWIRKTEAGPKWDEHLRFAQLGPARFGELLHTSATSPAMLLYLDQQRSFANAINENYAREIMELHTLGVDGGYTQADVTSLARLLTGWMLVEEATGNGGRKAREFCFDPALNDGSAQRVLGVSFPEAPPASRHLRIEQALEILASHPSTARHVTRKLAEHYVATPAPGQLVDDLARVFLETGGDMAEVLVALASHPEFWRADLPPRIATPIDFSVGFSRVCRESSPWTVCDFLQRSGMGLFDRAQPDGYPDEDEAYADSNSLLQRWKIVNQAQWALNRLVPDAWRSRGALDEAAWQQRVVDVAAVRLTGFPLSERSNQAALEAFAAGKGQPWERTMQTAVFVAQLPEANLR